MESRRSATCIPDATRARHRHPVPAAGCLSSEKIQPHRRARVAGGLPEVGGGQSAQQARIDIQQSSPVAGKTVSGVIQHDHAAIRATEVAGGNGAGESSRIRALGKDGIGCRCQWLARRQPGEICRAIRAHPNVEPERRAIINSPKVQHDREQPVADGRGGVGNRSGHNAAGGGVVVEKKPQVVAAGDRIGPLFNRP